MVIFPLGWQFAPKDLDAGGCSRKPLERRPFFPTGHGKSRRRVFLENAFQKRFSLGLEGAGSGVDFFGKVRPKWFFTAACFSDFKESQEVFSASTWGNRVGGFLKKDEADLVWAGGAIETL
jgi:hypothetical protein